MLQISTMLPGTLQNLRITSTFVTTPCVSVLEQPLTFTVASSAFISSSPKGKGKVLGKDCIPFMSEDESLLAESSAQGSRISGLAAEEFVVTDNQTITHSTRNHHKAVAQHESMWPT